jgi:DNA mismatch endonuclease (patch repair protein)
MHGTQPKGNRSFWKKKFARNKERDSLVNRRLRELGWRVIRIWAHELARKNEDRLLRRIRRELG